MVAGCAAFLSTAACHDGGNDSSGSSLDGSSDGGSPGYGNRAVHGSSAQGEPGELGGENVGGAWSASSPAGKKVHPPPGVPVGGNPNEGSYSGAGG
jgi:hypothetical protein